TPTTSPPPLSLHDALPILPSGVKHNSRTRRSLITGLNEQSHTGSPLSAFQRRMWPSSPPVAMRVPSGEKRQISAASEWADTRQRSEEHTSELQSQSNLVCR